MKKYNSLKDLVEVLVDKQLEENSNKTIAKRLQEDGEYQKFFKAALKKFGVKSPKDFETKENKAEFFDYVDKNYKQKSESLNEDIAMFMDAFTIAGGVVMGVLGSIAAYKGLKAAKRIGGNIIDNSAGALIAYKRKLEDKKDFQSKIKPVAERFVNDTKLAQMYKQLPQHSKSWSKKALAGNKERTKAMNEIAKYIKSKLSKDEQYWFKEISQLLRTGSTQVGRNTFNEAAPSHKGRTDLEGMKLYIEDKYPNDQDLKHIYNDLLRSVQINSQVVSWKKIEPIK